MVEAGSAGNRDARSWTRIAKRIRVPMGFVVAGVFLWLARPTLRTLLLSLLVVGPGLAMRAYAAGYVRKNSELTTTGPYAYTRNPLYLGSMLITLGFGAAARSWLGLVLLAGLFAAIYIPTILGEEEYLRSRFAGFADYAARVPRLIPRLTPAASDAARGRFSKALYLHHREYNSLMGAAAIYLVLALRLTVRLMHVATKLHSLR